MKERLTLFGSLTSVLTAILGSWYGIIGVSVLRGEKRGRAVETAVLPFTLVSKAGTIRDAWRVF